MCIRDRLLVELKDKLPALSAQEIALAQGADGQSAGEAEEALVALGYRPAEAARMIGGVKNDGASTEEMVRAALRLAARTAEGAA